MNNLDAPTPETIALNAMNWTEEDAAKQHKLYGRIVVAVVEGMRAERERLARWIVEDTHSMICRGTARTLQEAIREMG